jgi:hypothetical protein
MMKKKVQIITVFIAIIMLASSGCATKSAKSEGSKEGAKRGAMGGAVGGFLFGLITGDPFGGAAKGAAVGAGTGATMGAFSGAKTDRQLKEAFGEQNYEALMALVQRDYETASSLVAKTADDPNRQYRHASAWISALIARETLSNDQMEPYYDQLIELDGDVESREDAKVEVRLAQRDLAALRNQFNVK